jgi:hypothetical protein
MKNFNENSPREFNSKIQMAYPGLRTQAYERWISKEGKKYRDLSELEIEKHFQEFLFKFNNNIQKLEDYAVLWNESKRYVPFFESETKINFSKLNS